MRTSLLVAVALCAPPAVLAADAADPKAATAQIPHCSVLRAAPASEPERRDWRAANAATVAAGGWRAYAKEAAREPAVPTSPCPPPPAASGVRR
jgi:hypothetical protein